MMPFVCQRLLRRRAHHGQCSTTLPIAPAFCLTLFLICESRAPLPDPTRKVLSRRCFFSHGVDSGLSGQFGKRKTMGSQIAQVVQHFIATPNEQRSPVIARQPADPGSDKVRDYAGRAVACQCVVPFRSSPATANPCQVLHKQIARVGGFCQSAVEAYALSRAVRRPEADYVTFLGDYIHYVELTEKRSQSRIALTRSLSSLDRYREILPIGELETDDRMRNPWRAPMSQEEIHARDE